MTDGKDPAILDLDPDKPLPPPKEEPKPAEADTAAAAAAGGGGIPLKDVEEFQPYFKMLKMGLPKGAAQQKMIKEGKIISSIFRLMKKELFFWIYWKAKFFLQFPCQ